jgi:hypothetical protein
VQRVNDGAAAHRLPGAWQITMISTKAPEVGTVSKGLVVTDQNRVKLIYALPDGRTPTDFRAGEQQQMPLMEQTG